MKLRFVHDPTEAKTAMVAVFDLSGFSDFCNHPDQGAAIPKLVSAVFELFDQFTVDSWDDWLSEPKPTTVVEPTFAKFTGDGALLIWVNPFGKTFATKHRTRMVEAMRAFQVAYATKVQNWGSEWQANKLPKTLRVGISVGTVYPVFENTAIPTLFDEPADYVGYCINLAVRLQSHYREIGFMVQKSVSPELPGLMPAIAYGIKGAHDEEVLVFEADNIAARKANPSLYGSKLR